MSEDMGEKTEAPTARRREEAREQGNIARSNDLTAAAMLLTFMFVLKYYGSSLIEALRQVLLMFLGPQEMSQLRPDNLGSRLLEAIFMVVGGMWPLLLSAVVVAIVVNILQVGFHYSTKRLEPKLGALNPLRGLGRLFKGPNLVQTVINTLKMLLVMTVAWSACYDRIDQIIFVQSLSFLQIFGFGSQIIYSIALRLGVLLLILAIIDYGYQKWRVEKELKMTKEEVKEEMRRMDGDPKIKQRRRSVQMQMAQQRLNNDVPKADVVVTNPTEIAVAIKYDAQAMNAPRVIAKGRGYMAQKIREIAIASGVPIIERKPLARALFKLVNVGQEIPEEFYSAVAEILAYVYELTGKIRRRAAV